MGLSTGLLNRNRVDTDMPLCPLDDSASRWRSNHGDARFA